jgi:outer membrane protein
MRIPLYILFFFTLFLASELSDAQEVITLQNAVENVLKNNYAISIAKVQSNAAASNNNIGAAGFLPSVSLNASTTYSNNNTNQEYSTGLIINRNGVVSQGINSGIALNWTIFDGLRMFATRERLNQLQAQGEYNVKIQIENSVASTVNTYYDVVKQKQLIRAADEAIKLYDEQIAIAQKKLEIGSGSKLEVLQATIDRNAQKAARLKYKAAMENAVAQLNLLMARPVDTEYSINDTITIDYSPSYDDLKRSLTSKNNQLLFIHKNIDISAQLVKEARSGWLPQIGVNAAYNFTHSKNQAGLVLLNQNIGLNTGVVASWTIFSGLRNRTIVKNAKFGLEQSQIQFMQATTTVETNLLNAWKNFIAAQDAMKLEEENIGLARENASIALERFRIGSSNNLEVMIAQRSLEDALTRLVTARYDAKVAETELKRLNGELVK